VVITTIAITLLGLLTVGIAIAALVIVLLFWYNVLKQKHRDAAQVALFIALLFVGSYLVGLGVNKWLLTFLE